MTPRLPPCGMADCNERATHADTYGVGYCASCADEFCEPVSASNPFDPWWSAATLAREDGDTRWDGMDYGHWPDGVSPPVEVVTGLALAELRRVVAP